MNIKAKWHFDKALKRVEEGGQAGVIAGAEALLEASKQQVPLDSGALMESGRVDSDGTTATVSYGGVPYALRWHEEQANFQGGRKNKYLEDPANDSSIHRQMLDALGSNIKF